MNIIKQQIKYNFSVRTQKPIYIVVHDTANYNIGANALEHYNYFNNLYRGASADFFVDDKEIRQVNDYNAYYSWHCGDGKGKYGITNGNSVGIEMCVNADSDSSLVVANTIQLVYKLMKELNVPLERVVRHYDASRKTCPNSMSKNDWEQWKAFKEQLKEVITVSEQPKHFAEGSFNYLKDNGIIIKEERFNDSITRGEVFVLLAQVIKFVIVTMRGDK